MNLNEYMQETRTTVIYDVPAQDLANHYNVTRQQAERYLRTAYAVIKLNGEAGEVAEHIGKAMRDDSAQFTPARIAQLEKELGDVLWYWVRLCDELNIDPDKVLEGNVDKLRQRKLDGKLSGSGSER